MPDDYYDDSPTPAAGGAAPAEPEGDEKDGDNKTSILPKDFFHGDVKPGDTCHIRVTAVHENDVEIQCDHEDEDKSGDDDGGGEQEQAPPPSEGSMASMMD